MTEVERSWICSCCQISKCSCIFDCSRLCELFDCCFVFQSRSNGNTHPYNDKKSIYIDSQKCTTDNDNDSIDDIDEGVNFNYATKITEKLEKGIELWQQAINTYKQYEEYCLEERYKDVAEYIQLIRNDPDYVLARKGYSDHMYELARLRKQIQTARVQLGLLDKSNDESIPQILDSSQSSNFILNPLQDSAPRTRVQSSIDSTIYPISLNDAFGVEQSHSDENSSYARTLSKNWAERLGEVVPTQGEISSGDGLALKYKPKWPDFLPSVTYHVIKRNWVGQRMHRIIRLTEYHLLNIKNGNLLSKVYLFNEFRRVALEDNETVVLTLKSGKLLIFISHLAPNIVQQLITRIKVRLKLDRTNIDFSSMPSFGYSTALTAAIIQHISMDAQDATDAMRAFAHELRDRTLRGYISSFNGRHKSRFEDTIRESEENESRNSVILPIGDERWTEMTSTSKIEHESKDEPIIEDDEIIIKRVLDEIISDIESSSAGPAIDWNISLRSQLSKLSIGNLSINGGSDMLGTSPPTRPNSTKYPAMSPYSRNMLALVEGSNEYHVKTEIQKIVFDPDTPEGNTRNLFIEKFSTSIMLSNDYKSCLQEVRLFIDGMHGHILKKKGLELAQLLLPKDTLKESKKILFIDVISHPLAENIHPIQNRRKSAFEQKNIQELTKLDQEVLSLVSFLIFTVVEEATFVPLRDDILSLLPAFSQISEEDELQVKRKVYSSRSQEAWGIPEDIVSPLNWKSAIFELSSLESNLTPSMMLHALARTAKAIYSEFRLAVAPTMQEKNISKSYLSADDLVPIFIYIFCQSDLNHAIMNKELMWNLCHPDQLHGEYGYYLTAYESSIEFVMNERGTDEEIATIKSMIERSPSRDATDSSYESKDFQFIRNASNKDKIRGTKLSKTNRISALSGSTSSQSSRTFYSKSRRELMTQSFG